MRVLNVLPDHSTFHQSAAFVVLLAMAVYVVLVGVVKGARARQMRTSSLDMLRDLGAELGHQRIELAIATCERFIESHLAHAIRAGLKELRRCQALSMPDTLLALRVRESMDRDLAVQVATFKEHLGLVDAVGRTAPFVGLIVGTPGGLVFGTLLALLAVWTAVFLRSRADLIETELKVATSEIREFLALHGNCTVCGKQARYLHLGESFRCASCCDQCPARAA
jgi:hypothetical protein